ncbi:MAG: signal recognition particle-docking protein FtsY [Chloroflexota bacterium]
MLEKLRSSLNRTRESVFGRLSQVLGAGDINQETWDILEEHLIQADVGVQTTMDLVEELQDIVKRRGISRVSELQNVLVEALGDFLPNHGPMNIEQPRLLSVMLVVGANGSGKTTTVGKLARYYKDRGRKVILAAADTFRAAAGEQLQEWGSRARVPVISAQPGADPGAVLYDTIRSARARECDLVIADTAGRLHNKFNLMQELQKIYRVAEKNVHQAPHESLLVIDAPTGQNALMQARQFMDIAQLTGVVLTKLDGTAKGGMVFAIQRELGLPVRFVGTGEGIVDLAEFDNQAYLNGLFERDNGN